jgi:hypothetical protein
LSSTHTTCLLSKDLWISSWILHCLSFTLSRGILAFYKYELIPLYLGFNGIMPLAWNDKKNDAYPRPRLLHRHRKRICRSKKRRIITAFEGRTTNMFTLQLRKI